jgi:hypothetical protein
VNFYSRRDQASPACDFGVISKIAITPNKLKTSLFGVLETVSRTAIDNDKADSSYLNQRVIFTKPSCD